ncbi:MAG: sigma 54-interacting transcriptional regulator [Candidatus Eisenbacteria bacterium]|nr:sigma 54-interacting transcriptional regulator [Candidatus Eisenbacteria bacterium]
MPYGSDWLPPGFSWQRGLGHGAEGEVHLVLDLASGTPRAIKVLSSSEDAQSRARFEREFETLVSLRHPHIVAAHDFGYLADGRLFVVLDHLPGGSLLQQQLPAAPAIADLWLAQLLEALEFLHLQGLLHLDLKPANLLFTEPAGDGPPTLCVSDFGLLGRLGEVPLRAGTPGYVAPEVLRGETADSRADLYGVGTLAYELYTGRACFPGATPQERTERQLTDRWDAAPLRGRPELVAILRRLLSPRPDLRPADVATLRRLHPEWATPAEDAGVTAIPGSLPGAELAAVLEATSADSPRDVRITAPPGTDPGALLRTALGRLKTSGRRTVLLDREVRDAWRLLSREPAVEIALIDGFHELPERVLADLGQWRETVSASRVVASCDEALMDASHRAALRRLAPKATFVRLEPQAGGGGAAGTGPGDPLAEILLRLPGDVRRFLFVAAWIGEAEARRHAGEFAPPLAPPASLRELRGWLRTPPRLRAAAKRALEQAESAELATMCLRLSEALDPRDRADLAELCSDSSTRQECLLDAARASRLPLIWGRALDVLPPGEQRTAILDEALEAFSAAGGDPREEACLRERLQGRLESRRRCELLRRLAWCRLRAADTSGAREPFEQAVEAAGQDAVSRAAALADLGWHRAVAHSPGEARACYEEGLRAAPGDAHVTRSRLLNRLGVLTWRAGERRHAEDFLHQAAIEARAAGDVDAESASWSNLCLLLQEEGRLEEIMIRGKEQLARFEGEPSATTHVPYLLYRMAVASHRAFRYGEAVKLIRKALEAAEHAGSRQMTSLYLVVLASYESHLGNLDEADSLLAELPRDGGGPDRGYALEVRGEITLRRGDAGLARRLLEGAHRVRMRHGEVASASSLLPGLLEAAIAADDRAGAERWLGTAGKVLESGLPRRTTLLVRAGALAARAALGIDAEGTRAAQRALALELDSTEFAEIRFRNAVTGAELALEEGDLGRAEAAIETMEALLEGAGAPVESTRVEELRGALHAARGERELARDTLNSSARRFAALGHKLDEARVRERLLGLLWDAGEGAAVGENVLLELARLVHSLNSLEQLFERTMDLLLQTLPAERVALFLLDPARGTMELAAARGVGDEWHHQAKRASASVVSQVMQSGKTLVVSDAMGDARLSGQPSVMELGIRSVLCQPLLLEDAVIGTVYLDHVSRAGMFGEHHRALLRGFCRLIAVAVEQARNRARLARAEELLRRENQHLRQNTRGVARATNFVSKSPGMRRILEEVTRVAAHRTTVLLLGESGTGKERLAEILHAGSPRAEAPLVRFNCAAVAPNLMEAEIFGIEAGTASGVGYRVGIFECADGGTLLLDEVGDMDLSLQAKLLRVLENGEVRRVGGRRTSQVDVRVIAATNRNLRGCVQAGTFREDLYFRLSAVTLEIPPLRDRREDILPLAEHFLEVFAGQMGLPRPEVSPAFREYLLDHPWPGNVRELRNVIERALVSQAGPLLTVPQPLTDSRPAPETMGMGERRARAESEALRYTLESCGWNQTRTARKLGVSEGTVRYKMRAYGITRPE